MKLKSSYIFHDRLTRGSRKTIKMWQRSIAKEERYLHFNLYTHFWYEILWFGHTQIKMCSKEIFIYIGSHWNNDLHPFDLPWVISWRQGMSILLWPTPHGHKCFRAVPGKSVISLFSLFKYQGNIRYMHMLTIVICILNIQGVETASQIRYVTYYEKLLSMECTYPDPISLQIEKINISGRFFFLPMSVMYD